MKLIHSAPRLALAALLATAGTACGDLPAAPDALSPSRSMSATGTAERAALDELTLAVARAMNDAGLRQRVKADLRASRVTTEHKLLLSDYLKGQGGGMLLAKMSHATGKSRGELLALVGRVRPLEFYMPVRAHRETWRGGADLLVGSVLEDHTKPTVFDLAGRPVDVAVDAAPALPTLALVPVETDFSRTLDTKRFRNRNDRGGEAIGTLMSFEVCPIDSPDCSTECPPDAIDCGVYEPEPYNPPVIPAGLYYTGADLDGVGEGGLRGKPEIEVWVLRTFDPNKSQSINEPAFGGCLAGETKSGARYLNQDAENWSGRALVLDSAQAASLNVYESEAGAAPHGYSVQLWEDDSDPCQLRTTINMASHLNDLYSIGRTVFEAPRVPTAGRVVGPVSIQTPSIIEVWNAFTGYNDEYLGLAVPRASVPNAGHAGYTHILYRDVNVTNGAIRMDFR